MTLEEFFVKEYEKARKDLRENEKQLALLKIENKEAKNWINECLWFIEKTQPELLIGGSLWINSCFIPNQERDRALELLNHFKIKTNKNNEVDENE